MVVTEVSFGETIVYKKHNTKKIPLRTPEGKPVILVAKDCFTWGMKKGKFGGYELPLVLEGQDALLESLRDVREQCEKHLVGTGDLKEGDNRNILKSMYVGEKNTTLYAKVVETVLIRHESNRDVKIPIGKLKEERSLVHAAVVLDSIFVSKTTVSIQVKIREIMILNEKVHEEEEWEEMF